jgi:ubiquinone/menaquinone biosynthesis C-methylase UbiE
MKFDQRVLGLIALGLLGLSLHSAAQSGLEETWEKNVNKRQPPDQVMDMVGIKAGMIIGEVGAGRGRYTVHLARRVGDQGRIYANDIDPNALDHLKERCRKNGLANIETVLGKLDDPLFPRTGLDMVFMVWTFHMMEKPVEMLRSLLPYLRPGALVVMVEPVPAETEEEIKEATARLGRTPSNIHVVSEDSVRRDAAAAGFDLVRTDTSLTNDVVFILSPR